MLVVLGGEMCLVCDITTNDFEKLTFGLSAHTHNVSPYPDPQVRERHATPKYTGKYSLPLLGLFRACTAAGLSSAAAGAFRLQLLETSFTDLNRRVTLDISGLWKTRLPTGTGLLFRVLRLPSLGLLSAIRRTRAAGGVLWWWGELRLLPTF
jgi:hypothetical protein